MRVFFFSLSFLAYLFYWIVLSPLLSGSSLLVSLPNPGLSYFLSSFINSSLLVSLPYWVFSTLFFLFWVFFFSGFLSLLVFLLFSPGFSPFQVFVLFWFLLCLGFSSFLVSLLSWFLFSLGFSSLPVSFLS